MNNIAIKKPVAKIPQKKMAPAKKDGTAHDVFEDLRPKVGGRLKTKKLTQEELVPVAEALKTLTVRTLDTDVFTFKDEKKVEVKTFECTCCGVGKDAGEYYVSHSLLHRKNATMTVCKDCLDVIWKTYLIKYSSDISRALYYFCILVDIPFFKDIMEEVKLSEDMLKIFRKYVTKVISYCSQNGLQSFLDGQLLWDGQNEKDASFFEYDEDEVNYIPNKEDVKRWGKLEPQDLYFLKVQYKDWEEKNEIKSKGMEEVVKQLCFKQLRIQRLNESSQNTSKELSDFTALMTSAGLKPIQKKDIGTEENTLGAWIKRFENERPIPEPDPIFADVDGIWKKIRIWFLGHFSKVYNYENEYSREYEQEMSKNRVEVKEKYETKFATHQMGKELFKNE